MSQIDRLFFGGILVLFVVGVGAFALLKQTGGNHGAPARPAIGQAGSVTATIADSDGVCQCFNEGFRLAGSSVEVTSAQYRTGFEQCRAVLGVEGSEAWTAGWNARVSSRPFEATCRAWKRAA